MERYLQILKDSVEWEIDGSLKIDAERLLELRCYQTIERIYQIVADEMLDDPECFWRIKEIVSALDDLGIGGGGRHDF